MMKDAPESNLSYCQYTVVEDGLMDVKELDGSVGGMIDQLRRDLEEEVGGVREQVRETRKAVEELRGDLEDRVRHLDGSQGLDGGLKELEI